MVDDTQEMVFYPEERKKLEQSIGIMNQFKEIFDKKSISIEDCMFIIRNANSLTTFEIEMLCEYIGKEINKTTDTLKYLTDLKDICITLLQQSEKDTSDPYNKSKPIKEYAIESLTKDKTKAYHGSAIQDSMHMMRVIPDYILEKYSEPSKDNPNVKTVNLDKIPEKTKQFYETLDAIRFFREQN